MLIPFRDEARVDSAPFLTILLIGLNVTVYLFASLSGALQRLIVEFGFTPGTVLTHPEVIVSSLFIHANLLHLVSNMWFLWIYGDNIEDRFGRLPYLGLYLISGIVGNFLHTIFTGFSTTVPVIGASGAVAGVMGSFLVCFPKAKIKSILFLIVYPYFFNMHALLLLGLWMTGEFWMALVAQPGDHVAHWAHVGGFIVGILWGLPRRHRFASPRGWWW